MNGTAVNAVLCGPKFSDLDRHFARLMQRLAGAAASAELELAAALVSRAKGEGHICLDLARCARLNFPAEAERGEATVRCPELDAWLAALRATKVVGQPGEFAPLILDASSRLYLHRYWRYEQNLAQAIRERAASPTDALDGAWLKTGLARLFPALAAGETDWQQVAAFAAVRKKFCVISGGPGTGKTRTVVLLLALLLEQADGKLRIALAAPTGKAAARLQESVRNAKAALDCAPEIKAALPDEASTIHRLLGTVPNSAAFRHDAEHPLAADVIVVDEASMVDLALMAKLFAAIAPAARVVLLGDKDQLASVEAGNVLGDICGATAVNTFSPQFCEDFTRLTGRALPAERTTAGSRRREAAERESGLSNAPPHGGGYHAGLADCVVQLQKNYRFGAENGIHALSLAVNAGDAEAALALLRDGRQAGATCTPLPGANQMQAALRERVLASLRPCVAATDARTALTALNRVRILCALRTGPFGVWRVNTLVEEVFAEAGLIERGGPWYRGRPVMVTQNDYDLRLFNGDVGVIWPDASGALRAWFEGEGGELRALLPVRLPPHETVFAMTVHKSQGSEFEEVLLLLPDRESPVVTRELIYTGLTRASRHVELWLEEAAFRSALSRTVARASGLGDALVR